MITLRPGCKSAGDLTNERHPGRPVQWCFVGPWYLHQVGLPRLRVARTESSRNIIAHIALYFIGYKMSGKLKLLIIRGARL